MSVPNNSLQQQSTVRRSNAGSPSFSNSCRLHPIRATVPYQLIRGGQSSPTRSLPLSVGGNNGQTNSRGSSPGSSPPSANLSLGVNCTGATRQRLSPENRVSHSPDRGPNSPVCRGKLLLYYPLTTCYNIDVFRTNAPFCLLLVMVKRL
jgi:hypothetical protein